MLLGLVRPEENPCASGHIPKYKYWGRSKVLELRRGVNQWSNQAILPEMVSIVTGYCISVESEL